MPVKFFNFYFKILGGHIIQPKLLIVMIIFSGIFFSSFSEQAKGGYIQFRNHILEPNDCAMCVHPETGIVDCLCLNSDYTEAQHASNGSTFVVSKITLGPYDFLLNSSSR